MPNRRKAVRFELNQALPVYENRSHGQLGTVADISTGGFRLVSKRQIEKDDVIKCWLQLPGNLHDEEYMSLTVQCMWSRALETPGQFESGYKFVDISKHDAAVLLHLMINHGTPRRGERRTIVVG
jgi:hypothetical protein